MIAAGVTLEIGGQTFEWFLLYKLYILNAQNTQFITKMIFQPSVHIIKWTYRVSW